LKPTKKDKEKDKQEQARLEGLSAGDRLWEVEEKIRKFRETLGDHQEKHDDQSILEVKRCEMIRN
jgi:hypothetical protein